MATAPTGRTPSRSDLEGNNQTETWQLQQHGLVSDPLPLKASRVGASTWGHVSSCAEYVHVLPGVKACSTTPLTEECPPDPSCCCYVVVLYHHHVIQAHAVGGAPTQSNSPLVKQPQTRSGLAGVLDPEEGQERQDSSS